MGVHGLVGRVKKDAQPLFEGRVAGAGNLAQTTDKVDFVRSRIRVRERVPAELVWQVVEGIRVLIVVGQGVALGLKGAQGAGGCDAVEP